jgi:hypothetical protein
MIDQMLGEGRQEKNNAVPGKRIPLKECPSREPPGFFLLLQWLLSLVRYFYLLDLKRCCSFKTLPVNIVLFKKWEPPPASVIHLAWYSFASLILVDQNWV